MSCPPTLGYLIAVPPPLINFWKFFLEKCAIVPSDSAEVHKIRSKQSKSSATVPPVSSRGKPNEESERSTEEVSTSRKTSSTLIKYTSDETKTSEDARVDATVNDIMGAIKSLNVKVGELGKHHLSITQFAFEDKSLRNDVSKMRKAENIHEMADSSELLEFFYESIKLYFKETIISCPQEHDLFLVQSYKIKHLESY